VKVLVIAAHPDDEVLGCGGSIARLVREGHEVQIAILGEGLTSRGETREQTARDSVAALHLCSKKAADLLGVDDLHLFELPDNRFDTVPLLDVVKIVEGLLRQLAPEVVYTHHGGDLNVDHQVLHRAVLTATRPIQGHVVREVYAFEVQSSTEWAFQRIEPVFRPNLFVDITESIDAKVSAMSCYESETRPFPHPRSNEALQSCARRWGSVAGCDYAEAFELIRAIR
jgi:LmbE family N-acetylglucosaminyl deacetylase